MQLTTTRSYLSSHQVLHKTLFSSGSRDNYYDRELHLKLNFWLNGPNYNEIMLQWKYNPRTNSGS